MCIRDRANGSYHLHVLMKRMDRQGLFVPMKKLKQMWERGGVWIENLPFVDNFGAYFCPKFLKESTTSTDTVSKAHEKGTRIAFYPEHFRLYSCSRGIQKPVPVTMTYGKLKQIVGGTPPCYSHTTTIRDEQGSREILNSITYEPVSYTHLQDGKVSNHLGISFTVVNDTLAAMIEELKNL